MATMKSIKITPVRVTITCLRGKSERPNGRNVCATNGCDYGKAKHVVVVAR